ncbi:hypothetical protein [Mesorhizobium sp. A623]
MPDRRRSQRAQAVESGLDQVLASIDPRQVKALAVDGTSGTVLPVDRNGTPLAGALMYNDPVTDAGILEMIKSHAPAESAAHGATSGLAKLMHFQPVAKASRILHQVDWIAGQMCVRFDVSDENNALKTGYDPVARQWPDWISATGADRMLLPEVVPPGTPIGTVTQAAADRFGLSARYGYRKRHHRWLCLVPCDGGLQSWAMALPRLAPR